ncbi:related to ERG8-phosphomevalonate kinase [Serendipita indica DSM 11827]|uniref:Conserved oligomeric Golgi complex subunit 2 n=1 Tax=Serendipita indica (strain DSM 11827) TaxID=1109443 RepID=G4TBE6_SERID|nr:related to ERG8-phosphomevalonate kinase [Serendipita indica DSM 11827]
MDLDLNSRDALDRLTRDLAQREGDIPDNDDYKLPELEPLSHDHPLLSATATPQFDVEKFLLSRTHTSLTDLRVELRDYLAQLKEELVQLINDDYEAFISLSTDLRGEGARLERIHAPVESLRVEIQESSKVLHGIESAVQAKLAQRTKLREEKNLLRMLFNVSDSLTRLESLLLIPSPEEAQADTPTQRQMHLEDADSKEQVKRVKHLSRVAAGFVQLLYQADKARAEECAFITENQWRIDRIKDTLLRDLNQFFSNTLQTFINSSDKSPQDRLLAKAELSECLKTYDMLDMHEDAEEIIREQIVRPFTRRTIFTGALNVPHSPVVPRTPFVTSNNHPSAPSTPYTPFTAFPQKRGTSQSSFFVSEGSRLPLLDDSKDQLATLYNNILQFIERSCSEIMELASKFTRKHGSKTVPSGAVGPIPGQSIAPSQSLADIQLDSKTFDILGNVVWAEIGRALMEELGAVIFAAGKPLEFKNHYATTKGFLAGLEYLAPDSEAVIALRRHPVYVTFEKRWQLPVYFQLRWREIVGDMELDLSEVQVRLSLESGLSRQALSVLYAVSCCWSPDVYITELGHRFWKLTIQIIERYRQWIQANMPILEASQSLVALKKEKAEGPRPSTSSPRVSTPQPETSRISWATDDEKLRHLASLVTDIKIFSQRVMLMWFEDISKFAPAIDDLPLEEILRESVSRIEAIVPELNLHILTILTRKCCDPVDYVSRIPGEMRTQNRRRVAVTSPSPFVSEIFRPLRDFFGITGAGNTVVGGGAPPAPSYRGVGQTLLSDVGPKWAAEILGAVSSAYLSHLSSTMKNEEQLKRLRKGARSGFSLFGGQSTTQDEAIKDDERIREQMIMDVNRLGQEAEAFGVTLSAIPTYSALLNRDILTITMTIVSAPGKVLITGGYLVLDRKYSGFVVAASSRFYSAIEKGQGGPNIIRVKSPQFLEAKWMYQATVRDGDKFEVSQLPGPTASKNKFVHLALDRTIQVVNELKGPQHVKDALRDGLDIAILGANDFYSQRGQLEKLQLPRTLESLKKIPPFVHLGVTIENAHKTGMGSSAALITSLVGCLLIHMGAIDPSSIMSADSDELRLVHNVAQYVHCFAQGKVGSGFDVSAAIYGSHVYTRFDPKVIQPLMDDASGSAATLPILSPKWDNNAILAQLPPLTRLLLADVDAGSDSPSMASKVLKWRKENTEEAHALWTELDKRNLEVARSLSRLTERYNSDPKAYQQSAIQAASRSAVEWQAAEGSSGNELGADFAAANHAIQAVREQMKTMGNLAGVPIEPDEQTRLLNKCMELPGVIGGGVPGAGGYDAIWLLVLEPNPGASDSPVHAIERLWSEYTEMTVSPLLAEESHDRGVKVESMERVAGLRDAIRRD